MWDGNKYTIFNAGWAENFIFYELEIFYDENVPAKLRVCFFSAVVWL